MSAPIPNPRYLSYLKISTRLFSWYQDTWQCYPFYFRFDQGGLLFTREDFRGRLVFLFIQLILVAYYNFLWSSLYLNIGGYFQRRDYFEMAFHTIWSFCWGIGTAIQIHLRTSLHTLPSFYNMTLIFNLKMSEKFGSHRFDKGWKLCNLVAILGAFYMQAIPGFSAVLFMFLRHQPWYYFTHFPDWLRLSWVAVGVYALYDYWSIAVHLAAFSLQAFVAVAYVATVDTTLKFLSHKLVCKTSLSLREEVHMFSQLNILSSRFNECYGNSLIPCFKLAMGASFIGCTVGIVKMMDMGQPALLSLQGMIAIFGANTLLGMGLVGSLIEKGSDDFLKERKRRVHQRLNREDVRLIRATRVFAVKVLGVYSMDRLAPLTMIKVASIQVMTILVLFPHKLTSSSGN